MTDEPTREEREREIDWPAPDDEEDVTRSAECDSSTNGHTATYHYP